MEQLLSMLSGEVKRTVFSIERNGISTAFNALKEKFGTPNK